MRSDERVALGLSRDPAGIDTAGWEGLIRKARGALGALTAGEQPVEERHDASTALLACGGFTSSLTASGRNQIDLLVSADAPLHRDGSRIDIDALRETPLSDRVREPLSHAVPPFGYVARDRGTGTITGGTDAVGLQHIYVAKGPGYALVTTSSALAGTIVGRGLDDVACGLYSLIGNFLEDRSIFDGVRKLAPGEAVLLEEGRIKSSVATQEVPTMARSGGWFASEGEAVNEGRLVLENVMRPLASSHPEAVLELSGGLDSRVLLGIGRSCGYAGVRTMTIGEEEDIDVVIARRILSNAGLEGAFVPLSILDGLDEDTIVRRVARAARQRDFAADPVSGILYDAIEDEVPASAQISGIGGELARGNYYTGQRYRPTYDADLVEKIMSWRLASNFAAEESLFDPEFRMTARRSLRTAAWSYVADIPATWPMATDELYLYARLQPWGGAVFSRRAAGRQILAPLYHPDFIEWASRIPLRLKRNSRTFAALLGSIAPDLARIPLDSGVAPFQLSDRSLPSLQARVLQNARRVQGKLRRSIARSGKTPAGTARLAAAVQEKWRSGLPSSLASIDWLRQDSLERLEAGELRLNTSSVAFLMNLAGARSIQD